MRSQLEQVWEQTGIKPSDLELDDLPVEIEYLREVFWELWDGENLKWSELFYYQKIMEFELDGGEIFILKNGYSKCLSWINDKMRPKKKPAPKKGKR